MNLKTLFSGASSACFELLNEAPYYAPEEFKVLLDGKEQYTCGSNVFSLYGLEPKKDYSLRVAGTDFEAELSFSTAAERCCIDVRWLIPVSLAGLPRSMPVAAASQS